MTNWKEYKLGEIASIKMGQSPKSDTYNNEEIGLPFFQGNRTFGRLYPTIDTYCSSPLKIAEKNDVLFSVRAPVGDINYSPDRVCIGRGLCSIRSKSGNQNFLFYLLNYIKQEIINKESGTVFGSVNKNTLENIRVSIPDLPTQTAIAEILSSLDDKIELNNQINQELENLAQTLFKQWFIDFEFPNEKGEPYKSSGGEMVESELGEIPKGWEIVRLGDKYIVSDFVANGSFASLKENVTILDTPSFAIFLRNTDSKSNFTNQLRYVDEKTYKFLSKSKIIGNEVCISNVADVGTVFRPPTYLNKPLTLGNNLVYFRSDYPNYFYLYFKYFQGQDQIQSITSGSAQLKFNKTDFRNLNLIEVPLELLSKFDKMINELWSLQCNHLSENIELTNLRDTLLPKLISGELEVADVMAEKI